MKRGNWNGEREFLPLFPGYQNVTRISHYFPKNHWSSCSRWEELILGAISWFSSGEEMTHRQQALALWNNRHYQFPCLLWQSWHQCTDLTKPVSKSRDVHCSWVPANIDLLVLVRTTSLHRTSLRFTSLHCTIATLPIKVPCYSYHCSSILCVRTEFRSQGAFATCTVTRGSITESHIIVSYYSVTTPYDPPHLYDLSFVARTKAHAISYTKTPLLRPTTTFRSPQLIYIFISPCAV